MRPFHGWHHSKSNWATAASLRVGSWLLDVIDTGKPLASIYTERNIDPYYARACWHLCRDTNTNNWFDILKKLDLFGRFRMGVLQTFCWEIPRPFLAVGIFICMNMTSNIRDVSREFLWILKMCISAGVQEINQSVLVISRTQVLESKQRTFRLEVVSGWEKSSNRTIWKCTVEKWQMISTSSGD